MGFSPDEQLQNFKIFAIAVNAGTGLRLFRPRHGPT